MGMILRGCSLVFISQFEWFQEVIVEHGSRSTDGFGCFPP
jgi:hypothetical protein